MNKRRIVTVSLIAIAYGAALPALGQRTIERQPAPAPVLQQNVPVQTLQAKPAAPALSAHELTHVLQQTQPPRGLTRDETRALNRVSERLRHKDRAAAKNEWESLLRSVAHRKADVDVDALVAYVLRQSYIDSSQQLKDYADKVRYFNEQKRAAREQTQELRKQKAELERSDDPTATVTVRRLSLSDNYDDSDRPVLKAPSSEMTADSVAEELQRVVVLANTAEENEQMAQMDLQDALQKRQQTLQMMSNMSKMLHDTAKNMIQNMR